MGHRPARRDSRRGNATILTLSLGVLLGFSAFAIDVGLVRVVDVQLGAAVDAAALGGVGYLDGTDDGMAAASAGAVTVGNLNTVQGAALAMTGASVTVGVYDAAASPTFVPWDASVHDAEDANAVQVVHSAPSVSPAFGRVAFGVTGYTRTATSLAVRKTRYGAASSSECFLPLAVPDCYVPTGSPIVNPQPMKMTFSPSPSDNVAWGNPAANPNTSWIRAQLQGQCAGGVIEVGEPMYVNEGSHTSALHEIRDILNNSTSVVPDPWPSALLGPAPARDDVHANLPGDSDVAPALNFGNTINGPIALVDAGACGSPSFTGALPITGITWGYIFDVESAGGDKNIYVQLDFENDYEVFGDVDDSATGNNVLGMSDPMLVVP